MVTLMKRLMTIPAMIWKPLDKKLDSRRRSGSRVGQSTLAVTLLVRRFKEIIGWGLLISLIKPYGITALGVRNILSGSNGLSFVIHF